MILRSVADAVGLTVLSQFNVGEPDDYRVPDSGLIRDAADRLYFDTAALVVEILSPRDETWDKLPFYAAHLVDEVVIVDPVARAIHWLGRSDARYAPVERSALIDLGVAELGERIDWPPAPESSR